MASNSVSISTPTTTKSCSSLAYFSTQGKNHHSFLHDEQDCIRSQPVSLWSSPKARSSSSPRRCGNTANTDQIQVQNAGRLSHWKYLILLRTIWNLLAQFCSRFIVKNTAPVPPRSMNTLPSHISFDEAPQPRASPVLENEEMLDSHASLETVGRNVTPPPTARPDALLNGHSLPNEEWEVYSSWGIADPARRAIPRSFEGYPRGRPELLHIQLYQSSVEEKYLMVSQELFAVERHLHRCRVEEASLHLTLESKRTTPAHNSPLLLDSTQALSISEATRRSIHAYKQACEARLAQGQVMVQRLVDALEEATNMLEDADQQMFPILNSFLQLGWSTNEIPRQTIDTAIFPIPAALSQLDNTPNNHHYPYLSVSCTSPSSASCGP